MSTITEAAVVERVDSPFEIQEVELDALRPDEVLLRMVATGLCHTDLSVQHGVIPFPLPGIVGHEGAGVVEAVGTQVTRVRPGDRALASFTSCGGCPNCVAGHPAYCESFLPLNLLGGRRADGSHTAAGAGGPLNAHFFGQSSLSRVAIVDERSLVRVPPDARLEHLAPLGCGIQTGAGAILNVLRPEPGSRIAVFGAGAVGMAAVMASSLTGAAMVIAVDLVGPRAELATELGATAAVDANAEDAVEEVLRLTGGRGVHYAIECTGSTAALGQALRVLSPLGACAVIGAPAAGSTAPFDVNFMLNGRRIVGITEGDSNPEVFIPALAHLVSSGRLPIDRLIREYGFEQIEQAAADARSGKTIKPVLRLE